MRSKLIENAPPIQVGEVYLRLQKMTTGGNIMLIAVDRNFEKHINGNLISFWDTGYQRMFSINSGLGLPLHRDGQIKVKSTRRKQNE